MTFLILLYAHLLADYPLQSDFLAKMKGQNHIVLAVHAGLWTGTILLAVHLMGYGVTPFDVFTLFSVHAVADYCKARQIGIYKRLDALKSGLLLDQSIHIVQIIVLMDYKGMF